MRPTVRLSFIFLTVHDQFLYLKVTIKIGLMWICLVSVWKSKARWLKWCPSDFGLFGLFDCGSAIQSSWEKEDMYWRFHHSMPFFTKRTRGMLRFHGWSQEVFFRWKNWKGRSSSRSGKGLSMSWPAEWWVDDGFIPKSTGPFWKPWFLTINCGIVVQCYPELCAVAPQSSQVPMGSRGFPSHAPVLSGSVQVQSCEAHLETDLPRFRSGASEDAKSCKITIQPVH